MSSHDLGRLTYKSGKLRMPRKTGLYRDIADTPSLRNRVKPITFERAQAMKLEPTPAELKLMHRFKNSRLRKWVFRRQEVALGYIMDFYFPAVGICVEADGRHHANNPEQAAWDRRRDSILKTYGIDTIRITNDDALNHTTKTVARIREKIFAKAYDLIEKQR